MCIIIFSDSLALKRLVVPLKQVADFVAFHLRSLSNFCFAKIYNLQNGGDSGCVSSKNLGAVFAPKCDFLS